MKSILYHLSSREETGDLLVQTQHRATEDNRISEIAVAMNPREEPVLDGSTTEQAQRCWRVLLPRTGDAWFDTRLTHGWTRDEAASVIELLTAQAAELRRMVSDAQDGWATTAMNMEQDAERLEALVGRWAALVR